MRIDLLEAEDGTLCLAYDGTPPGPLTAVLFAAGPRLLSVQFGGPEGEERLMPVEIEAGLCAALGAADRLLVVEMGPQGPVRGWRVPVRQLAPEADGEV